MFDWNAQGPAAIVGAVVATVGVLLLEIWLKPRYARKRVATILLAEIEINIGVLIEARNKRTSARVGDHLFTASPTLAGWDAAKAEIHYLPPDTLRVLLACYGQFKEIEEIAQHVTAENSLRPEGGKLWLQRQSYVSALTVRFDETVESAIQRCRAAVVVLQRDVADSPP